MYLLMDLIEDLFDFACDLGDLIVDSAFMLALILAPLLGCLIGAGVIRF